MLSPLSSNIFLAKGSFSRFFANAAKKTLYERVDEIIEKQVRPALKADGGDVELHDVKDGIVVVSLQGMCSTCPSAKNTLQNGILGCIQDQIPEIVGIRQALDFEDF